MINEVICPHCESTYVTKNGQKNGKQRYQCKACSKKFTYGEYIKQGKNIKKEKNFKDKIKHIHKKDKIFNFEKLNIDVYSQKEIATTYTNLDSNIMIFINDDLKNNTISLNNYKNIIEEISSDEENEIAKRLANIDIKEIELCMNKTLFQNHHNEKLDAFIMKILISTHEEGMRALMDYINNSRQYEMTKYNFNVIGKHMSQELATSWKIMMQYMRNGISKNCAYTITRYINYVARLDYRELRDNLSFEEIRTILFDRSLDSVFSLPKISDSDYLDNFSEYVYSLNKILTKMAKKELINFDYLEQYNNSIFAENNIENCLERATLSVNNKNRYDEIVKDGSENMARKPWKFAPISPVLTKNGIRVIGNQLVKFYYEYCEMEFRCLQKEFEEWLDKYSNYIYTIMISYGIDGYKSFFRNSWGEEFIFRCKISSRETEGLAEKICEEFFKNPRTDYPNIIDNVFGNLLYTLNEKAIDTFIYMIDNKLIIEDDSLFYQKLSFNFVLGVTEKIYGDFYNIKSDFSYRRINKGGTWEKLVGCILNEKYKNIIYHPILDNKKIPDYGQTVNNRFEKIIECKLILGIREFKETIKKYHSYCDLIEFYCLRNDIDENIINSDEYKQIMSKVSQDFKYEIKDFNDIYKMTNRYEEVLSYFEKNVKQITQKNLLKEKISINFTDDKKEKILYLLDFTFKKSGLF